MNDITAQDVFVSLSKDQITKENLFNNIGWKKLLTPITAPSKTTTEQSKIFCDFVPCISVHYLLAALIEINCSVVSTQHFLGCFVFICGSLDWGWGGIKLLETGTEQSKMNPI